MLTSCARVLDQRASNLFLTATCKTIAEHSIWNKLKSRIIGPILYEPQRSSGPWSVCMANHIYFKHFFVLRVNANPG